MQTKPPDLHSFPGSRDSPPCRDKIRNGKGSNPSNVDQTEQFNEKFPDKRAMQTEVIVPFRVREIMEADIRESEEEGLRV